MEDKEFLNTTKNLVSEKKLIFPEISREISPTIQEIQMQLAKLGNSLKRQVVFPIMDMWRQFEKLGNSLEQQMMFPVTDIYQRVAKVMQWQIVTPQMRIFERIAQLQAVETFYQRLRISTSRIIEAFEAFEQFKKQVCFPIVEKTFVRKFGEELSKVFLISKYRDLMLKTPMKRYKGRTPLQEAILRGIKSFIKRKRELLHEAQRESQELEKVYLYDINLGGQLISYLFLAESNTRGGTHYIDTTIQDIYGELRRQVFEAVLKQIQKALKGDKKALRTIRDVVETGNITVLEKIINYFGFIAHKRLISILEEISEKEKRLPTVLVDPTDEKYDPDFLTPDIFTPEAIVKRDLLLEYIEEEAGKEICELVKYRAENLTKTGKIPSLRDLEKELKIPKSTLMRKFEKAQKLTRDWLIIRKYLFY